MRLSDFEEDFYVEGGLMEVETTEPIVIGELLGPDGEVLRVIHDRTVVEFGFRR